MRPSTTLPGYVLRWMACGLLLNGLTSCASSTRYWEAQDATPQQVLASEPRPARVRVTLSDLTWVVLRQPTIARDSVFGEVETGMYRGQWLQGGEWTGIPVDSVRRVAVLVEREEPEWEEPTWLRVLSLFAWSHD